MNFLIDETNKEFPGGFLLWQAGGEDSPEDEGGFAFFLDDEKVKVNHRWFRGLKFDPKTIT